MSEDRPGAAGVAAEPLLSSREGSVLVLTLNRPERLNAVSLPMYRRIEAEIRTADAEKIVKDVTHRVLPITEGDISEMLTDLRIFPLLDGARGRPKGDFAAVVAAAVSNCLIAHPSVVEVEVNPLFVYAEGALAVDARLFVSPPDPS